MRRGSQQDQGQELDLKDQDLLELIRDGLSQKDFDSVMGEDLGTADPNGGTDGA